MCFSASVSYGAAAVLVPAGLYAVRQAGRLQQPYIVIALAPVLFGIQQAVEGRLWQLLGAGNAAGAVPLALAYHFFSHFLWLWWIPLSSWFVEENARRKRIFLGIGIFGFLTGGLVYASLLLNPDWLSVKVKEYSIRYRIRSTVESPFDIDIPVEPSALYAVVILVPLLFSSHRHLRIFGMLITLSIAVASVAYDYAFVSVWCFFAAVLSLYLVFMIRRLGAGDEVLRTEQ